MSELSQDVALRCGNVKKSYSIQKELRLWRILLGKESLGKKIDALHDISMSVPRGKIVGVLGKNGAGKSTLLRVLGGVYGPTKGRVEVFGQIAGLFEMGGMSSPNLTGREYATRYLSFMGVDSKEMVVLLEDIFEFSELEEAFDHRVRTYSSGMSARLYFATATSLQSEIYLIDELLGVGDEHFQAKCWRRMRDCLLNGASGVLVTHDWAAILKLCEQAHVIDKGQFVYSGASDKAVVSYLKVPSPEAIVARFSSNNPQNYVAYSGKNMNIQLGVEILEPAQVDISISVEVLNIGIGWEIVLLTDTIPVAEQPGRYMVNFLIPNCPLTPGDYSLNVFLSRRKHSSLDASVGFDTRSWTLGNGVTLHVEGKEENSLVKLPYRARKLGDVA
jgi:lipopolysaccharide transport system ATP-binding protein